MAPHSSKSVIYAALVGNLLVAASKFGAAWFTGSSAMLSEAIHSLVDTGNQALLLNGMHQAAKPATSEHPFGHGLQLYFWTFIVAILIFGLGAGVAILEGIQKILNPHPLESAWVNYTVLALSLVFEGITWLIALRAFRAGKGRRRWLEAIQSSKDPTVFTVLFEDTAALLGLLVAGAGIAAAQLFDLLIMDGMASVVIGLLLALTATLLAYESQSLLTGEGVQPEIRVRIRNLAEEEPGVVRVNELLTMHFGPQDITQRNLVEQQAQRLDGGRELSIAGGYNGLAGLVVAPTQDVMTVAVDHFGPADVGSDICDFGRRDRPAK